MTSVNLSRTLSNRRPKSDASSSSFSEPLLKEDEYKPETPARVVCKRCGCQWSVWDILSLAMGAVTFVFFVSWLVVDFPECATSSDCSGSYTCSSGTCSCTAADFSPYNRPYRCDDTYQARFVNPLFVTFACSFVATFVLYTISRGEEMQHHRPAKELVDDLKKEIEERLRRTEDRLKRLEDETR